MSRITARNLVVRYPVFDAKSRTLKGCIKHSPTGGTISAKGPKQGGGTIYVEALSDLSFVFESDSRVGIFGHNGSGKTTLLKVLAGIYPPTSGLLEVRGDISSFIDIAAGVDNDLSGYEAIYIRGLMMGRSRSVINREIESIIDFSGLGEFIHMPIRTYSSGMWARLAFSIATAFHTDIILLDEWLSVGDTAFQVKAQNRLTSIVQKASILVLASQSIELLREHCDRIITLEHGQIKSIVDVNKIQEGNLNGA